MLETEDRLPNGMNGEQWERKVKKDASNFKKSIQFGKMKYLNKSNNKGEIKNVKD